MVRKRQTFKSFYILDKNMAGHTGIYATSAECIGAAGEDYAATEVIEARINEYCLQAEGAIHTAARQVFAVDITAFTAMPAGGKGILAAAEAAFVGMKMLAYNPLGESNSLNRIEFEDRINILRDTWLTMLGIIKDEKMVNFIMKGE